MIKKFAVVIIIALFCLGHIAEAFEVLDAVPLPADIVPFTDTLSAENAVLMDMGSGSILFEKDAHSKRPIASVTKIMTLLLLMESLEMGHIDLADEVRASHNAAQAGRKGTSIFLEQGEIATVEELLLAVTVASANDAAVALAEHTAGSIGAFVQMMNEKAKELGMNNTQFMDPSGLDDSGYSTAFDVALMSKALMQSYYPDLQHFLDIYLTYYKDGTPDRAEVLNTNKRLLRGYDRATGLKTGWTTIAGFCLSATALEGDMHLNAVVLGCNNDITRYRDVVSLFNYGFAQFEALKIAERNIPIGQSIVDKGIKKSVNIVPRKTVSVLIKKGSSDETIVQSTEFVRNLEAPVQKGAQVGEIVIRRDDQIIARSALICQNSIEKASLITLFNRVVMNWTN